MTMTTVPNRTPDDASRAYVVDPRTIYDGHADFELVAASFLTSYRNRSTRQNYRQALEVWFAWCERRSMNPLRDVQRPHIEFWARHLEEVQGLALRTIAGRLNALSGYYRTAVMDGWIETSPMSFVRRPRIQRIT